MEVIKKSKEKGKRLVKLRAGICLSTFLFAFSPMADALGVDELLGIEAMEVHAAGSDEEQQIKAMFKVNNFYSGFILKEEKINILMVFHYYLYVKNRRYYEL